MVVKKRHPSTFTRPVAGPSQFTVVRWCHYGRWNEDGRLVTNAAGDIIYPFIQRRKR